MIAEELLECYTLYCVYCVDILGGIRRNGKILANDKMMILHETVLASSKIIWFALWV